MRYGGGILASRVDGWRSSASRKQERAAANDDDEVGSNRWLKGWTTAGRVDEERSQQRGRVAGNGHDHGKGDSSKVHHLLSLFFITHLLYFPIVSFHHPLLFYSLSISPHPLLLLSLVERKMVKKIISFFNFYQPSSLCPRKKSHFFLWKAKWIFTLGYILCCAGNIFRSQVIILQDFGEIHFSCGFRIRGVESLYSG